MSARELARHQSLLPAIGDDLFATDVNLWGRSFARRPAAAMLPLPDELFTLTRAARRLSRRARLRRSGLHRRHPDQRQRRGDAADRSDCQSGHHRRRARRRSRRDPARCVRSAGGGRAAPGPPCVAGAHHGSRDRRVRAHASAGATPTSSRTAAGFCRCVRRSTRSSTAPSVRSPVWSPSSSSKPSAPLSSAGR